jgi:hypothetical protein
MKLVLSGENDPLAIVLGRGSFMGSMRVGKSVLQSGKL